METPIITHLNREDCKFITWTQNDRTVKKRFYDTETDTDMENRSDPFEFDQLRFVRGIKKGRNLQHLGSQNDDWGKIQTMENYEGIRRFNEGLKLL